MGSRHLGSLADSSRSTTPGSGPASAFSTTGSVGSLTSADVHPSVEKPPAPLNPRPPPLSARNQAAPVVPRRPSGRPREDSVRRRRIQQAVETAATDLVAYNTPQSVRSTYNVSHSAR